MRSIFPQDEHERLLIGRAGDAASTVERRTELDGFEQDDGSRRARRCSGRTAPTERAMRATSPAATARIDRAARRSGIGFPGGTYEHVFYVADVEARARRSTASSTSTLDAPIFSPSFR